MQEKYCTSSNTGLWKLPTGFINESEEIFSGAVREVKEETGVTKLKKKNIRMISIKNLQDHNHILVIVLCSSGRYRFLRGYSFQTCTQRRV